VWLAARPCPQECSQERGFCGPCARRQGLTFPSHAILGNSSSGAGSGWCEGGWGVVMGDGMRRATGERRAGGGMHAARGPLAVRWACVWIHCTCYSLPSTCGCCTHAQYGGAWVGGVRVGSGDPASESSACSVTLGVWKGGTGFVKLLGVLVCPDSDAQFKIPA
jgi:hypothetical protein